MENLAQQCRDAAAALKSGDSFPTGQGILLDAARHIEDLEAANDAAERYHRISSNGNLWRFWSDKARDLAGKNEDLTKAMTHTHNATDQSDTPEGQG